MYEGACQRERRFRQRLVNDWGLPAQPFGEFLRAVNALREGGIRGSILASNYLSAFAERRAAMAETSAKLQALADLAPALEHAQGTFVFAQTIAAADAAIGQLAASGFAGASIQSSMTMEEREDTFDAFERGDLAVVAAPRLLDEGMDVPAADLAIVLATSSSRRQLIQRMGRVVRRKADRRPARLIVLYVAATSEDPDIGAHEDFLDEVIEVAQAVRIFPPGSDTRTILDFLDPRVPPASAEDATRPAAPERPPASQATVEIRVGLSEVVPPPAGLHWESVTDESLGLEFRNRVVRPQFLAMLAATAGGFMLSVDVSGGGDARLKRARTHLRDGIARLSPVPAEARSTGVRELLRGCVAILEGRS